LTQPSVTPYIPPAVNNPSERINQLDRGTAGIAAVIAAKSAT
jgi:hypothetical protein